MADRMWATDGITRRGASTYTLHGITYPMGTLCTVCGYALGNHSEDRCNDHPGGGTFHPKRALPEKIRMPEGL